LALGLSLIRIGKAFRHRARALMWPALQIAMQIFRDRLPRHSSGAVSKLRIAIAREPFAVR
jgi:hypothetical protein